MNAGVLQKTRTTRVPRFAVVLTAALVLIGTSMILSGAAQAHAPEGWSSTDLLEGNTNPEVAGTLYYDFDGDTVYIHWHLGEAFEGEVTNQIVCAGEFDITPPSGRCKPGQQEDGTVFWADPIGDDNWSFEYSGDETSFQIHLSITGEEDSWSILANFDKPEDPSDDDAPADDSSDAPADDSSDAPADDSSDAPADDSSDAPADDSSDAPADDSSDDGVLADDSVADDGSTPTDDGSGDDVLGRTVTKPLAQTGPETTVLALIGFAMLLGGAAMRFGRFGTREVFASASISQSPADLLAKALQARSRHWTCSK